MEDLRFARFKRAMEWFQADPSFQRDLEDNPKLALMEAGLGSEDASQIQADVFKMGRSWGKSKLLDMQDNPYIQEFYQRLQVVEGYVQRTISAENYRHEGAYRFSRRIKNRSFLHASLMRGHTNIHYFPLAFELSQGCRVHCAFCAFSAPLWEKDAPYDGKLWQELLEKGHSLLGEIAGQAPLYFATEPLDNPDYEKYLAHTLKVFGHVPQTTTAAPERDICRTRGLMEFLGEERLKGQARLRFSIRSLSQLKQLFSKFSPQELVNVEVLLNNPESVNRYSRSGRTSEHKQDKRKTFAYSISCLAGVKVNLVQKTLTFMEPMVPSPDYPLGVRVRETLSFEGVTDYGESLARLFEDYARPCLTWDTPLSLSPGTNIWKKEDQVFLLGDRVGYQMPKSPIDERLCSLLKEGGSPAQIMEKLQVPLLWEKGIFQLLEQLLEKGYLMEL